MFIRNFIICTLVLLSLSSFAVPGYAFFMYCRASSPSEEFLAHEAGFANVAECQAESTKKYGCYVNPFTKNGTLARETKSKYQARWQAVNFLPIGGIVFLGALCFLLLRETPP